ncbi:SLBB domain-containing protein [Paucibacter sp. XJ19-41]|uniref:SLBB domain-containing protein n=1 Tax=Paucibacter sp. XJ19-41 TaxID=2927824 RepID=UPI00234BFDF7|nr:SLBB domain-containing protein [Paucibacter sp. XJ19-41]MDC6166180.1 SLBB domain-containing protein [Paucibacter sp. XJ19-41]
MNDCDPSATTAHSMTLTMTAPKPRARAPLVALLCGLTLAFAHAAEINNGDTPPEVGGPVRLTTSRTQNDSNSGSASNRIRSGTAAKEHSKRRYKPGEFELYVNGLMGWEPAPPPIPGQEPEEKELLILRLGAELMNETNSEFGSKFSSEESNFSATDTERQIPPDYRIGVGDELQISIWGAVDADLRLTVDRGGRIVIPRVGPVLVAGVRYADLDSVISARVGQVFRNFQLSASLGRLRGIRIYVTGFTPRPGAYTVSSLSTVVSALMKAGGPSAAGSFRQIELRRENKILSQFDMYDLLLKGNKSADIALQAEDVVHIGPVGPQVAILGSVNKPVIAELKPNETVADVLAMAGGFSPVADRSRLTLERLSERNDRRVVELGLPAESGQRLSNGDVLRIFSSVNATLPQYKQFKRVRIEGEVARPGEYILPPSSSIIDLIRTAGGLTPQAYIFGTEFTRESVRVAQQENYERALRDLETEFTRNGLTQKALSADQAATQATRASGSIRLIERLRAVKPTGRIVLQLRMAETSLPDIAVEEGDHLLIPARPTTVGVFGSVFNGGSYLLKDGASVDDIVRLAGGPTRNADTDSIFVLRANGSVVSARQSNSGWLSFNTALSTLPALPGDTVFVPEELNKTSFGQEAKEWTQILYQFGLGAAALHTLKN